MISVSGRKTHPVMQFCKTIEQAEAVMADMITQGYKNVRISDDSKKAKPAS